MSAKSKSLVAIVLVLALLAGCRRPGKGKLHVILIVDLSASTLQEARAKAFNGVKALFQKGLVKRGDSVTVVPITSDALIESQGNILRFELSPNREAYEDDLRRLEEEVNDQLLAMQKRAEENPYAYSDILGAVKITGEEFATDAPGVRRVCVLLSDCIQDTKQLSFMIAHIVANKRAATEAAKRMAADIDEAFSGARVYIGMLRSTDLKKMSPQRREGVEAFWTEYFKRAGAKSVQLSSDGPGQLTKFMSE